MDIETYALLNNKKIDKVNGKGLSSNDYTTAEKSKLAGIEDGAQVNEVSVEDISRLSESITEITEVVTSDKNLFTGWIPNSRYTSSGVISTSSNANYIATDLIDCAGLTKLFISGLPNNVSVGTLLYNADGSFNTVGQTLKENGAVNIIAPKIRIRSTSAFSSSTLMEEYINNNQTMLSLERYAPYEPSEEVYLKSSKLNYAENLEDVGKPISSNLAKKEFDNVYALIDTLPVYYLEAIEEAKCAIIDNAELDALVFGVFTDIHFASSNDGKEIDSASDPNYDVKMTQLKVLNKLANESIIDFTMDGGDLLTYSVKPNNMYFVNDTCSVFAESKKPHFKSLGDHELAKTTSMVGEAMNGTDWAKITHPYMPNVMYSDNLPNCYYYDFKAKKIRFVQIDSGGELSGAEAINTTNLWNWLLNEVFTDDVKNGWRFIVWTHGPIDWEWRVGMQRRTATSSIPKWKWLCINDLFEAINSGVPFAVNKAAGTEKLYFDSDGVLVQPTKAYTSTMDCNISGALNVSKDFTGWTSKVRLVASGHVHCDRLNAKTNGKDTSYAIAYTGSASPVGYKDDADYYVPVFGTNGKTATWENLRNREIGTINEALMDVYIVNSTSVHKIRIGCGNSMAVNV